MAAILLPINAFSPKNRKITDTILWNMFLRMLSVVVIAFTPQHFGVVLQPYDCITPPGATEEEVEGEDRNEATGDTTGGDGS